MTTAALLREAKGERGGTVPSRRPLKTKKGKTPKSPAGDDPGFTKKDLAKGVKPPGVLWGVWGPALKAFKKGGSYSLFQKPGAKPKKKKDSPLPHLSPSYRKKHKYELLIGKQVVSRWKKRWGDPLDNENIYNALVSLAKSGGAAIPNFVHDASVVDANGKTVSRAIGVAVPGGKAAKMTGHAPGKKVDINSLIANDPHYDDDWGESSKKAHPIGHWTGGKGGSSWAKSKPKPVVPLTPEENQLNEIVRRMKQPLDRQAAGGVVFKTFEGPDVWQLPVLVCKTAAKYGGYWVFPKGGLDPGESLHKGAAREVREEAGVKSKVADNYAYVKKSVFGDSGRYDIHTVKAAALLVAKTKDEKKFIKDQTQALCRKSFQWGNETHYFVMQWVSGKPDTSHVAHGTPECTNEHPAAEMQDAKWVPLARAATMSGRMRDVVKALMRTITKLWRPPAGVEKRKPRSLSSLRTTRIKQINPKNPKPGTGKPPAQGHLPWANPTSY